MGEGTWAQSAVAAPRDQRGISSLEALARAARQVAFYGPDHPVAEAALQDAWREWMEEAAGASTEVRAEEEGLFWNGQRLPPDSGPVGRLLEAMRERLIASITFSPGTGEGDLARLLSLLAQDPGELIAAGGAMRAFNREGAAIEVEEVDFARQLRESEALWAEACSSLGEETIEALRRIFDECIRTIKLLGDHRAMDRVLLAMSEAADPAQVEAEDEEERAVEEIVATRAAQLLQAAGELACFADESYWEGWRARMTEHLAALGREWIARIFRAPASSAPGSPDILTLIALELDPDRCVEAVLGYPGAIFAERWAGRARARCPGLPVPGRRRRGETRPRPPPRDAGISEDVYRNVVGLLLSDDPHRPGSSEAARGDRSADGMRDADSAGAELSDLLVTLDPGAVKRARLGTLVELLGAGLGADQHARMLTLVCDAAQQAARDGDTEGMIAALQGLGQAAQKGVGEDAGRRALAAAALAGCGIQEVVARLVDRVRETTGPEGRELVNLLGGLGELGMEAVLALAREPHGLHLHQALEVISQRDTADCQWLRRLVRQVPAENLRHVVASVLASGSRRAIAQLGSAAGHPNLSVRLELIGLLCEAGTVEAAAPLGELLDDPSPPVRLLAAEALGRLRAVDAVGRMCQVARRQSLFGSGARLRATLIAALGEIGSEAAVPLLREVLLEPSWLRRLLQPSLRPAAAEALGRIGGEAAEEALEAGSRSRSRLVRAACHRALGRLGRRGEASAGLREVTHAD